jgi:hypothetical protein
MLPCLHNLSIHGGDVDAVDAVDASWQWDAHTYQVRFSIDQGVVEQIMSLGSMTADDQFEQKPLAECQPRQLTTVAVLELLKEYTVQRLWDMECAIPRMDIRKNDDGALPKHKEFLANNTNNEPFPDDPMWLVGEVAKWTVAVNATSVDGDCKATKADRIETVEQVKTDICKQILDAQQKWAQWEIPLKRTLVDIEKLFARIGSDEWAATAEGQQRRDSVVAEFLVRNKDRLVSPTIATVRRLPPPTYYYPRNVIAKRYTRFVKMAMMLHEQVDGVRKSPHKVCGSDFKHTVIVPQNLDGSFFTGRVYEESDVELIMRDMQMEHIVPRSHLKNSMLVKEFGYPEHYAMLTTFATKSENTSKGDKYMPLAVGENYKEIKRLTDAVFTPSGPRADSFNVERRQMAARIVAAGYLSFIMLERNADANTELGARKGGIYYKYRTDVHELMTSATKVETKKLLTAPELLNSDEANQRIKFRRAWNWEAGLALLQWYLLLQPYNPLPNYTYRTIAGIQDRFTPFPYFTEQLYTRFGSSDIMSEMMRYEMQEEISNAPLGDGLAQLPPESRQKALCALENDIKEGRCTSPSPKRKRMPDSDTS